MSDSRLPISACSTSRMHRRRIRLFQQQHSGGEERREHQRPWPRAGLHLPHAFEPVRSRQPPRWRTRPRPAASASPRRRPTAGTPRRSRANTNMADRVPDQGLAAQDQEVSRQRARRRRRGCRSGSASARTGRTRPPSISPRTATGGPDPAVELLDLVRREHVLDRGQTVVASGQPRQSLVYPPGDVPSPFVSGHLGRRGAPCLGRHAIGADQVSRDCRSLRVKVSRIGSCRAIARRPCR